MKRGLSDVVTTVLIILFAIVAVAIIGGVVINQVNKAGTKISQTTACSDISVEPTRCSNDISSGAYVVVQRGSSGAYGKIKISNVTALFEKADGTIDSAYISDITSLSAPLSSTKLFSHTIIDNVKRVGLAVEITNADGSKTSCDYYKTSKRDCFKGNKIPLLGYWTFDTSGDYKDYSGNGNDLVKFSATDPAPRTISSTGNGYLYFADAITDRSLTNAAFNWPTSYSQATVSFWANVTVSNGGSSSVFGVGSPITSVKRFQAHFLYYGWLYWDYGNSDVTGRCTLNYGGVGVGSTACQGDASCFNEWTHMALVSDGTTKKIYINGVNVNSTSPADHPDTTALTGLYIGKATFTGTTTTYYFNGSLDEFMIYNQTLTSDEINRIYNFQRSKFGV